MAAAVEPGGSGGAGGEFRFGRDDELDELLRGGGGEEGLALRGVLEKFTECADDLQVIARLIFRSAEHEHEVDSVAAGTAVFETHAGGAAADCHDDGLGVLGAGVGQGDAVAQTGGVEAIAFQKSLIETVVIEHVGMSREQACHFIQGGRTPGALHLELNPGGIEKSGDQTSHANEVIIGGDSLRKMSRAFRQWQGWSRHGCQKKGARDEALRGRAVYSVSSRRIASRSANTRSAPLRCNSSLVCVPVVTAQQAASWPSRAVAMSKGESPTSSVVAASASRAASTCAAKSGCGLIQGVSVAPKT